MAKLRKMEMSEIELCGELHFQAFYDDTIKELVEYSTDLPKNLRIEFDFESYFSRFINETDKYAFCIIVNKKIVGYITALEIPSITGENTIYIDSIAIEPSMQKRGYGSKALKQFMNMFSKSATKRLLTTKSRPAYKMYQKLGFIDMEMQVMECSLLNNKIIALEQEHAQLKQEYERLQQEIKKLEQKT